MNRVPPLIFLVMIGTSLLSQSVDPNAAGQERYALNTLTKYCWRVEVFSHSQQPRIFARLSSALGASSGWAEFDSNAAWQKAGQPKPLALVWQRDGAIVRVAISGTHDVDGKSYADYCYRPDGNLAQLRFVPDVQTNCDELLLHCHVTIRGAKLYPPEHMNATLLPNREGQQPSSPAAEAEDWGFRMYDPLFHGPLKPEKTTVTFAPVDAPEYMTLRDLPFNSLLYVPTHMEQ